MVTYIHENGDSLFLLGKALEHQVGIYCFCTNHNLQGHLAHEPLLPWFRTLLYPLYATAL